MRSEVSIVKGEFFDHTKKAFITCPFNKHKHCVMSCALVSIDYEQDIVTFGCGCGPEKFDLVYLPKKEEETTY